MQKTYTNSYLLKRFLPYYGKYYPTLILDLICAGFSTMCDLVLPIILRYLTNTARQNIELLTLKLIITLGAIFTQSGGYHSKLLHAKHRSCNGGTDRNGYEI